MNSRWLLCLLGALLISAFPLAASESEEEEGSGGSFDALLHEAYSLGHLTFAVGPHNTHITWEDVELGDNASRQLRETVDGVEDGEQDGQVSEEEAETMIRVLTRLAEQAFAEATNDRRLSGVVLMDDNAEISDAAVDDFRVKGLVGPVDGPQRVGFSLEATIHFETRAADVHSIQVNAGQFQLSDEGVDQAREFAGDFRITIEPQNKWAIDADSIQPDCVAARFDEELGRFEFTGEDLECFRERGGDLVAFSITGHDDRDNFVPGPGALWVSLGLLGLAWRRRKA